MIAILVSIRALTPLLFTGISNGEENSSRSLSYIPGAALRGALVARFRAARNRGASASAGEDLAVDPQARQLFFSGAVRFLNGYPAIDGAEAPGLRSLPRPASWRKPKGADESGPLEAADFAIYDANAPEDHDARVSAEYCSPDSREPVRRLVSPHMALNLHITAETYGVVRAGQNTIYQYEALAAGQAFVAAIVAEDARLLAPIQNLIQAGDHLGLGRSRSAEYGQAVIEAVSKPAPWAETPPTAADRWTVITLLSDLLLRDAHGQPTLDLDTALAQRLNKPGLKNKRAFILPTAASGFNTKWKLPLTQAPAIGMGSVFVYSAADLPPADLHALVEAGLGERRVDGFGRMAVNWQAAPTFKVAAVRAGATVGKPQAEPVPLSTTSQALAQQMAERLLRRKLDDLLLEKAQPLEIRGDIQNHQLSRLRSVVRSALAMPDRPIEQVLEFLDEKRLKPTALKQFRNARVESRNAGVGRERLYFWVRERLEKADAVEAWLGYKGEQVPQVAGQPAAISDAIRREYTLRLIERLVDGKMKQNPRESVE